MIFTRRSSGIFAPDPEPLVLPDHEVCLGSNVRAALYRAKSGTLLKEWRFHNKLVNTYLDALGTNTAGFPGVGVESDTLNFFAAGTGVTPPTAADLNLNAEIAGGRASTTFFFAGYRAGPPDYCEATRRGTFSTAQANGTIGEFGWFGASSGAVPIRARAVPKDTTGAQTTIIKTSAATLVLDWSIYIYYIQSDFAASRTIGGTTYAVTARAIGANASTPANFYFISRAPSWGTGSGALGSRTQGGLAARTGSSTTGTDVVVASLSSYVSGSYTRDVTFTTQAMAAFAFLTNCGGTSGDQYASMQMGFSPSVPAGQPLKCRISWAPVP